VTTVDGDTAAARTLGDLVLASRSPRRIEILGRMGLNPRVVPADIDESPLSDEDPVAMVRRLAAAKARVVRGRVGPQAAVLAADTTVDLDGVALGQPADASEAAAMLKRMSGRTHRVHTAVAFCAAGETEPRVDVATSLVTFHALTEATLEWYIGTGEPFGKAGSYAVQGLGATLVSAVRGSWSNVVGLPVAETARLLGLAR